MRKLLIIAAIATIMGSCGKAKITQLTSTKDSLAQVVHAKDSILNVAFLDIDEIASSLSMITEQEKLVTQNTTGEITKSKKEQINDNIAAISGLLEKNREALARLNSTTKKLAAANVETSGLKKLVASLEQQIKEKDQQIEKLTQQLEAMNIEVKELSASVTGLKKDKEGLETKVTEQSTTIDQQTSKINTVQYIVGSEKELIAKNVIDKKGFIGRTGVVGSNLEDLKKADLRNLERIKVGHKKIKIVTSHPDGSYILVQNNDKLVEEIVITDKDKFWSNTKILIVSYK